MARKQRVDGLTAQAHIVCGIWNIHVATMGGLHPAAWWEVSQEELAELFHIGRATAQRAIKALIANDCLTCLKTLEGPTEYLDPGSVTFAGVEKRANDGRGKLARNYRVDHQQLIRMAVRLETNQTGLLIIQDPSGRVHLAYRQTVREFIDVGIVVPHKDLSTWATTDVYLYLSNELEAYSSKHKRYVSFDLAIDEILQSDGLTDK